MNKIYTEATSCDHDEIGGNEIKADLIDFRRANSASAKELTELALVESLKLHLRTSSLFDSLRNDPVVH
jgi:hypothetical protein